MNRRVFIGATLAGLSGFLFSRKLKADEIIQYDLGTDHIVIRYEVLSKFLRPYKHDTKAVFFPSCGWIPLWKPERLRGGSVQLAYKNMIEASTYKYAYILHNSEENMWGFYSTDEPL